MKPQSNPNLLQIIGHTPIARIRFAYQGQERFIYAKLENFNMTGSIKDRIALHVIEKSYEMGTLKPGDEIVEATSGNTGISFSCLGAAYGHPVTIYMPNWMSQERIRLIKSFGANIVLVSPEEGGFLGSIEMTKQHQKENANVFLPNQFDNELNIEAHYTTTGPEIFRQMKQLGKEIDAFVAGVGTGGTVMGTGDFLKEMDTNIKVHPLEPSNSPTLSTGYKVGKHRIQGISDEFIPSIVDFSHLDSIIQVDDGDAIIMAQKLAEELGLGVGISSGANFLGALEAANQLHDGAKVVTIFSDCNKKYLSTDLCKEEPIKEGFLSSEIKLLDYRLLAAPVPEYH
ncbi:MAG: cysteine synthase family protein [Bacteroidia bacterium]